MPRRDPRWDGADSGFQPPGQPVGSPGNLHVAHVLRTAGVHRWGSTWTIQLDDVPMNFLEYLWILCLLEYLLELKHLVKYLLEYLMKFKYLSTYLLMNIHENLWISIIFDSSNICDMNWLEGKIDAFTRPKKKTVGLEINLYTWAHLAGWKDTKEFTKGQMLKEKCPKNMCFIYFQISWNKIPLMFEYCTICRSQIRFENQKI